MAIAVFILILAMLMFGFLSIYLDDKPVDSNTINAIILAEQNRKLEQINNNIKTDLSNKISGFYETTSNFRNSSSTHHNDTINKV